MKKEDKPNRGFLRLAAAVFFRKTKKKEDAGGGIEEDAEKSGEKGTGQGAEKSGTETVWTEEMVREEVNREKSKFFANMSHEMRTPINAVMGMNEMILRETDNPDIRNYSNNIQSASQALLSLINNVLDCSKIEAGEIEIAEDEYYLHELVGSEVQAVERRASQKGLLFLSRVDRALPDGLYGDAGRIRQIMDNILGNAVKYTKEGKIILNVTGETDKENGAVNLKIRVKDTGVGIRRADLPKLFEKFERLDLIKNRTVEGTGLGLAITYQLVKKMGGKLEVESTYGEGSEFTVILPQKIFDAKPVGDFRSERREPGGAQAAPLIAEEAEILVVDDNEMNLFVVKNLLKRTKVRVTLCKSGKECLKMMQRKHFDVILLDHMMPELDGIETMKISRTLKNSKCLETPIIALTANAVAGMKEMYLREGFDDYLSKPVNGKQLEDMLRKHMPEEKQEIAETPGGEVAGTDDLAQKYVSAPDSRPGPDMAVVEIVPLAKAEKQRIIRSASDSYVQQRTPGSADGSCVKKKQELQYLDIGAGEEYAGGDQEMYREFLEMFCDMREENAERITRDFDAGKWADYVTGVHALKSTSLTVGALKLSEKAKKLELSGKEFLAESVDGAPEYILENHGEMMELYENTCKEAAVWLKKEY